MVDPKNFKTDHIFEISALVGEYSFRVGELPSPRIRVKVFMTDASFGGDRYTYAISHNVHTPTQIDAYYPSAPFAATEEAIVRRAIRDTLSFYVGAISAGHKPSTDWFVENEDFDSE
ncbi:MAG: hypothetical protein ACLPY1_20245 [Terracidiphilus sp.]